MEKDSITSEINDLKKKLVESPDSLVFAPLADAYRKQGSLEEALQICKKGLEKHPAYTSARVVLGRIYQEKGKIEDAAAEFKKVLESDSDNLMAHSLLGSIFMKKNDYQAAIEEYQKILTLNPDDEETQSSLKQAIELAAGDQKSNKSSKKESGPADKKNVAKESTATITIADLYLKQGHFDKAIEVYQELLAHDPQNLMFRQKLSEIVDRQQKEGAGPATAAKPSKSNFTQPPDQKGELIAEESSADSKSENKPRSGDDSKFTSEDILQVMRRGGKDDVMVDEKTPKPSLKKKDESPVPPKPAVEKSESLPPLKIEQVEGLKGILAELSAVSGIIRCFLIGNDGITVVSIGETSNNADLGKQALAIFQSTHRSVDQLHQGKLQQVLVTAETGHILLVSFSNFVLIVLASEKINLGLLRLALDSALKKLDKIL
jgi:tetratricopeptide (TPR) repeat protein